MKNSRLSAAVAVSLEWFDENGKSIVERGLTENIGRNACLIRLPRRLPNVGGKVLLKVEKVEARAVVIRLDRNAAHQQVSLKLIDNLREWKREVFEVE